MDEAITFWLVARFNEAGDMEVCGLYSTEAKAVAACEPEWFIAPLTMDVPAPRETTPWPGSYVPSLRAQGITDYEVPK